MPDKKTGQQAVTDPALLAELNGTGSSASDVAIDTPKLSQAIADVESDGGDYSATNPKSSATGKYQFLWNTYGDDIKKRTGVKSRDEFLNNPKAQEDYFSYHVNNNLVPAVRDLKKYNSIGYSDEQLAKLVHFKGAGGAKEWLQDHEDDTTDNNTSIDDYVGTPEASATKPQPITDPELLAQLNGDTPAPAATQPAPAAPVAQQTPQQITNSVFGTQLDGSPIAGATQVPAAPPQPESPQMSQQAILNQTLGTQVDGSPVATVPVEQTPQEKTHNATMALAQDYAAKNIAGRGGDITPYTQQLNQITDPHGDPSNTGSYVSSRLKEIDQTYQQQLADLKERQIGGDPTVTADAEEKLKTAYAQQKAALQTNAGQVLALQHFNKDVTSKELTPAQAEPQIAQIGEQQKVAVDDIDKQMADVQDKIKKINGHGIMKQTSDPELGPLMQQYKDLTIKKNDLTKKYNTDVASIQNSTKYNPIQLGAAYAASMGDRNAAQDLQDLAAGKPIPQDRQYAYNKQGNSIMATGAENTVSPEVKAEVAPYLDPNGDKLFQNNKGYIMGQMADQRYNDINVGQNPLYSAVGGLFPTHKWTKDEVEQYGKQQGLSDEAISDLQKDPSKLANAATYESQFAAGALSPYSALYERGARALASLGGVPSDMVNEDFAPGWETRRGPAAYLTGNIPGAQNSFSNVPAVIGHIMEGAGSMAGIVSEVGAVSKGLQETGMAEEGATKLANFGVMSFNGYNDAYHNSLSVIGDKPEDETKRQVYSLVNGLLSGAIFSISPQSLIAKNALGMSIAKTAESDAGKELVDGIMKNGGVDFLATQEGKNTLANYAKEFAKENGTQVSLATAQKLAEDVTNKVANPDAKQDIPEDLKNTAMQTCRDAKTVFLAKFPQFTDENIKTTWARD